MFKGTRPLGRVDVQVSILAAAMVLIASFSVFVLCYHITYNDMIRGLTDRVMSIYNYVEDNLDKETFYVINEKEDMETSTYRTNKVMLEEIKNTTGVLYLYTAKEGVDGKLVYAIDGLSYDAPDFRYPGDVIEPEIQDVLHRALEGELILPNKITDTHWGKIFITYMPIHDGDKIIGVVGIEFGADHQFDTYRMLIMIIPLIMFILCMGAIILAVLSFRRISNPFFKDTYNTDRLTGLKSRNAFDVDVHNINARKNYDDISIVVLDLNFLKKVNDTLGHAEGDRYLCLMSKALKQHRADNMALFRTGGDEFVALVYGLDSSTEMIQTFICEVQQCMAEASEGFGIPLGAAAGYATYDQVCDKDIWSVYRRADKAMYDNKRKLHALDLV